MITLALAAAFAHAQVVTAVPTGVRAVTVQVCDLPSGCPEALAAYASYADEALVPVLVLEDVLAAGPEGGEARAAWTEAWGKIQTDELDLAHPSLVEVEQAWTALALLPLTMPEEVPFTLLLLRGDRRLAKGNVEGAKEDMAAAATSSARRVTDLPPLSEAGLAAYLGAADARHLPGQAAISVMADVSEATVYLDGDAVGAAPIALPVLPGWHRVSVERPGRATAWVGTLMVPADGALEVRAELADEDASDALIATLVAGTQGKETDPIAVQGLVRWARQSGLDWVRIVRVIPAKGDAANRPEERIEAADQSHWNAYATWLDVSRGRLVRHGPGPAALQVMADRERFRVGIGLGAEVLGARVHAAFDFCFLARITPWLAADVRVGLLHSGEEYYLYENWTDRNLYPLRVGARLGSSGGGPYGGLTGLVVVPYTVGGQAFLGWELAPSSRWRVGLEARGGWTDAGMAVGGLLSFARRG